ncbi:MAG: hypothetical protein J6031_04435 [Bacteroidales bacterium]|nr:hypothetical protein [Bacteroidales bacterium]
MNIFKNLRKFSFLLILAVGIVAPVSSSAQKPTRTRGGGNSSSSSTANPAAQFAQPGFDQEPDTTRNDQPQGIIFDNDEETDSILRMKVMAIEPARRSVKMTRLENPSLNPTGAQFFNAAHQLDGNYYLDLGALGQCQTALFPNTPRPLSPLFEPDIHPVYRHNLHRMKLFQTLTPYTLLSYNSSLNKDYQIHIIHTQNIQPRWNIAFLYDLVSRDGLYTNSGVTNNVIDVTTNYYSADSRYQLQAGISNNRLRQQENGGVQNDASCWSYPRESGVPVNMYSAQNQWRDLEVWVHQSFNTVRQFEHLRPIKTTKIDTVSIDTVAANNENDGVSNTATGFHFKTIAKDTVIGYDTIRPHNPHSYNTGVFAIDINYSRHRRTFYDNQANSWFYNPTLLDTTFYYDSTRHHKLYGELYWTNDAYMSHRWKNPFVLLFGIRPEYNQVQFATDTTISSYGFNEFTVSPFAQAVFNLGKFRLKAMAEEVNGGNRTGDYRLSAQLDIYNFSLSALSEATSPDYIFYHNEGNYAWNYTGSNYNKIKQQQLKVRYLFARPDTVAGHIRLFDISAAATLLSDNVWFDASMLPTQGSETALLTQASAMAHLQFGWFNIRLQQMLQNSSDDAVIRVPLFASKNSLFADFSLFRGALQMQTGFDLRYHTKYRADGWNPLLGAFYRQDDVEVGNYLVADFWINLQVKRASIYLKASHFNAPLEELPGFTPNYFSLPHYPLENFGLYWGITWKFFN